MAAGLDDATLVEADGAPGFRASASTYIAMGIGSGAAIVLVTASSKLGVYDSTLSLTQIQAADPVATQDVVTLGYLAAYGGGGSSRPGPAGRDGEDGEEGPPGPRGRRGPTGATGPAGAPASDAHLYAVRTLRAFR